jgi:Gram-negative bacterial TonB protein C-terminal
LFIDCVAVAASAHTFFRSPQVASVTDAYLPYEVIFDGFIVLNVSLDKQGEIVGTEALRNPGAMVPAAIASVRTWKIRPGELESTVIPSEMTAVFVYRPRNNGPAVALLRKDFKPVLAHRSPHGDGAIDYVPVGIVSFAYPDYPVNSAAWGSVVVQVTAGKADGIEILRGMEPFNDLAIHALRNWRFQAATVNGKAVSAKLPIASIFQTPTPSL